MKLMYFRMAFLSFRCASLFALTLVLFSAAQAQQFGPIVTIPIERVWEEYDSLSEDGSIRSCGVRLYAEWPAYLKYTNSTSYRMFTPDLSVSRPGVAEVAV